MEVRYCVFTIEQVNSVAKQLDDSDVNLINCFSTHPLEPLS